MDRKASCINVGYIHRVPKYSEVYYSKYSKYSKYIGVFRTWSPKMKVIYLDLKCATLLEKESEIFRSQMCRLVGE